MAGLFYAWSCSVIPGLANLGDTEYILSMQAMNRAIVNPAFLIFFIGTAILLPVCTYLIHAGGNALSYWLLAAASVFYIVGVLGVTFAGNIPLNNALEAFHLNGATAEAITSQRINFEKPWTLLHSIRTVCSVITLMLVAAACLKISKG